MGLVYRVNQIFLNKEFALKTIDKHCMSEIAVRRFQQEARTAFSLDHPSIIAVNDFGVLDDHSPFLVMELVRGETLGERLKRTGPLTLEEAIPIFLQVCFGLAYAHECGVVHRDIKPNNIMLLKGMPPGSEGSVKIVDFGIAKFTQHEGGEMQALTRTGEIFGSPYYMSPEQCTGGRVDHRADIYALGCVFFEALTGAPPYVGENALTTMMKHQTEPASTLKQASLGNDFPPAIENIVATMLAKSPDNRYQNLGTVVHDLGALRRGDPISVTRSLTAAQTKAPKTISMSSNKFYLLMVGVPLLTAAVTGFLGYIFHDSQGRNLPVQPNAQSNKMETLRNVALEPETNEVSLKDLKKVLAQPSPDHQLEIANRTQVSEQAADLIANAQWIQRLVLHGCEISKTSVAKLAKLPNLSAIDLSRATFDDAAAGSLSACQRLQDINASSTSLSDEGVSNLARMKSLRNLALADTHVGNKGLIELAKSKGLRGLSLRGDKKITNLGLQALEKMSLNDLNLESTCADDPALVYVAKIESLKTINLKKTNVTIKGVQELFRNCKNLTLVNLHDCSHIGPKELEVLRSNFPAIQYPNQLDQDKFGSLDLVLALVNLADACSHTGKNTQAEQLYKRALALGEKHSEGSGENRSLTGTILRLANCNVEQRNLKDAKPLYERALALSEKAPEPYVGGVVSSLKGLANCNVKQGKFKDAKPLYERALALSEKAPDLYVEDIVASLVGLAECYQHEGKTAEADQMMNRARAIASNRRQTGSAP
jgi:serine/threonine protein kinase